MEVLCSLLVACHDNYNEMLSSIVNTIAATGLLQMSAVDCS